MVDPLLPNSQRRQNYGPREMQNINRFSASSSSDAASPRQSLSSHFSVSDLRGRSVQTPVSSVTGVHDLQPATNARFSRSTNADGASTHSQDDPDVWFQRFRHEAEDTEPSDDLPTVGQLDTAGNIPIYDSEGKSRLFKELYQGPDYEGQRQLIIFVRHFYCGVCQAYIKALTDAITPTRYFSLPIPTTITLIGCGRPSLLAKYLSRTSCPFRMYTDPTRKLYKALKMPLSLVMGKKSSYHDANQLMISKDTFGQMIKAGLKDGTTGGNLLQIGGEFLFEDGEPLWCHRMKVMRDHTEMKAMERVLKMTTYELRELIEKESVESAPPATASSKVDTTPTKTPDDVITRPPQAVTSGKGMKLVWHDRGDDAPPLVRLERGKR